MITVSNILMLYFKHTLIMQYSYIMTFYQTVRNGTNLSKFFPLQVCFISTFSITYIMPLIILILVTYNKIIEKTNTIMFSVRQCKCKIHVCMYVNYIRAELCNCSKIKLRKSYKPNFCLISFAKFLLRILINASMMLFQDLSPAFRYSRKSAFLHSWTSPLCVA